MKKYTLVHFLYNPVITDPGSACLSYCAEAVYVFLRQTDVMSNQ